MHRHYSNFTILILFISISFLFSHNAFAGWEVGLKGGSDSNINRAVEDSLNDTYMTGFLSFTREPSDGTDTDWSLNLFLEGTNYADSSDLNCVVAGIMPSIIFYPSTKWSVSISPFIEAIEVKDEEQSSFAFGGEVSIKQLWGQKYYTGEYFVYTDSRADIDIYSYKEKAVGLYAGINWTDAFWSEIGYGFSRGDSFRAVEEVYTIPVVTSQIGNQGGTGGQGGAGQNNSPRYSEVYNSYIINEPVDCQTIGVNMGYQFTSHIFSFINYSYTTYKGNAGNSKTHTGTIGVGYSF